MGCNVWSTYHERPHTRSRVLHALCRKVQRRQAPHAAAPLTAACGSAHACAVVARWSVGEPKPLRRSTCAPALPPPLALVLSPTRSCPPPLAPPRCGTRPPAAETGEVKMAARQLCTLLLVVEACASQSGPPRRVPPPAFPLRRPTPILVQLVLQVWVAGPARQKFGPSLQVAARLGPWRGPLCNSETGCGAARGGARRRVEASVIVRDELRRSRRRRVTAYSVLPREGVEALIPSKSCVPSKENQAAVLFSLIFY
eukprot:scaffold114389_cov32-Tisochrysis_lutea.AAC.3